MKKLYCYLGLLFSGFVINILFAYLLLILTFITFPLSFLLDITILIIASSKIVSIIKLFKQKFNISAPAFIILSQLPIAIISTAYFIFIKFNGFILYIWNDPLFGYEIEYLLSLATSISSTIILYLMVITCLVIYIIRKVSEKRNSKLELNSI